MSEKFDWTDDRVTELRRLWGEGFSMSQIGRRMGVSKNAVIGKCYRLGLKNEDRAPAEPRRADPRRGALPYLVKSRKVGATRARKPAAPKPPKPITAPTLRVVHPVPRPEPEAYWKPLGETHKPWTERLTGECSWPLDLGEVVHSCCAPVSRGGYCETHARLAFRTDDAASAKEFARSLRRYA